MSRAYSTDGETRKHVPFFSKAQEKKVRNVNGLIDSLNN
jgi:hypothetical protein